MILRLYSPLETPTGHGDKDGRVPRNRLRPVFEPAMTARDPTSSVTSAERQLTPRFRTESLRRESRQVRAINRHTFGLTGWRSAAAPLTASEW